MSFTLSVLSLGKIVFPRDEGDKNTPFDWWYLTCHFTTETKKRFSYTVVYIRDGPDSCIRQTSITYESKGTFFSEIMPGDFVSKKNMLNLSYQNKQGDKDSWCQKSKSLFSYNLFTEIHNRFRLNICLTSNKPPMVHGNDGLISMGNGGDSFYYSLTNLSLNGTFTFDGATETIQGVAWIDRQWGFWNTKGYDGWEWFALQLNDNTEIMLYLFYDFLKDTMFCPTLSILFNDGVFVNLKGQKEFNLKNLNYLEVKNQGLTGYLQNKLAKSYFSNGWRLKIYKYDIDLTILPMVKNQRIVQGSWEGSCSIVGKHAGVRINCVSTVELTHLYVYPFQVKLIRNLFSRLMLPILKRQKM